MIGNAELSDEIAIPSWVRLGGLCIDTDTAVERKLWCRR